MAPSDSKKYLVSTHFWSEREATAVLNKVSNSGIMAEVITGRMPRQVFKVTSSDLPDEKTAKEMHDIATRKRLESVIERL